MSVRANPADSLPLIALTMGDPRGIGPEVLAKSLGDSTLRDSARWLILGLDAHLRAVGPGLRPRVIPAHDFIPANHAEPSRGEIVLLDFEHGEPSPWPRDDDVGAGEISYTFVEESILLCTRKAQTWKPRAVVTAPISKHAWAAAGHSKFPGHTELFAARCGVTKYAMMFHAPPEHGAQPSGAGLNVILVTTHCPLADVPRILRDRWITDVIELGHEAMARLGVARPRIGVCGLNPHAGEQGLLGVEDERIIAPAIQAARARGIDASGPHPADTIFAAALSMPGPAGSPPTPPTHFDLVVAMYHDQGLIPLKTLARDRAVNMTVGLPIIRTSPDHGTAFDIAGRNLADAGSMSAAMRLAVRMARG